MDTDTSSTTEDANKEVMLKPLTGEGTGAVQTGGGVAVPTGVTDVKYGAPALVNGGRVGWGS